MEFNSDQLNVIRLDSGWHACLAPAGSGKTEVLTERVSNAIENGISPNEIICLTFTNRAARSMLERIEHRLGDSATGIFVGNIHAFALSYIQKNHLISNLCALADQDLTSKIWLLALDVTIAILQQGHDEIERRINHILAELPSFADATISITEQQVKRATNALHEKENHKRWNLRSISSLILPFVSPNGKMYDTEFLKFSKERLLAIAPNISVTDLPFALGLALLTQKKYAELKLALNLYDFDDILLLALQSLMKKPCSAKYMSYYSWCQIDEVQDISPLQWLIIESIITPQSHCVMFGDIKQSIYRFMGASIEITEHHLGDSVLGLNVNYRSPLNLVEMANVYCQHHFIDNYMKSYAYKTARPAALLHMQRVTLEDHDRVLIKHAARLAADNRSVALLLSTNKQVSGYSKMLSDRGIEHFCIQEKDLLSSQYGLDFMAFLQVIYEPKNRLAWSRLFWRFGKLNQLNPTAEEPQIASIHLAASLGLLGCELMDFLGGDDSSDYFLNRFVDDVRKHEIVYFDTETTGLDPKFDAIIQIAGVKTINGLLKDTIDLYCSTTISLEKSFDIHHISDKTLSLKGRPVKEQIKEFLGFAEDSILIAHNLPFDDAMLKEHIEKHLPENYLDYLNKIKYCTLDLARRLYPDLESHKLGRLLTTFCLDGVNSHNALDDVNAGMNLMVHLANEAEQRLKKINAIISPFSKPLDVFNNSFFPLWQSIENLRHDLTPVSINILIDLYFNFIIENKSYDLLEISKVDELRKKLGHHAEMNFPHATLDAYLENCMPFYQTAKESDLITERDKVVVSTIHRSKGLEFEYVILPMMVDGNIPSFRLTNQLQQGTPIMQIEAKRLLEEQKRLTYVALTRAKEQLVIGTYTQQSRYIKEVCPFLDPVIEMFQNC